MIYSYQLGWYGPIGSGRIPSLLGMVDETWDGSSERTYLRKLVQGRTTNHEPMIGDWIDIQLKEGGRKVARSTRGVEGQSNNGYA
jgi:hypothetical protein